jgi:nucleoside-diphosphate-sugar epimerase
LTTLIVGCGYVGTALAERLVKRDRVIALTRSPRALPIGVEPLIATLPDDALRLPSEIERVVYAVAPDARTEEAYQRAYPLGVRSVLAAVARSLERFVLVSSTAVYAEDAGRDVDPDAAVLARGPTTDAITAAERLVLETKLGVVARLSGIYGPGRTRLVREIREGRVPGDSSRIGNRIHRDDAAAAIEHVLFSRASALTYDVTDSASVPMGEIYEWIARRLGVELDPSLTAIGPKLTGKRVDNARLLAMGFALRYPTYREGYGPLLAAD